MNKYFPIKKDPLFRREAKSVLTELPPVKVYPLLFKDPKNYSVDLHYITSHKYSQPCVMQAPKGRLKVFNSFPASGDFCCLLTTFANSLDPDQAWQNVGPDLDPNCLTLWWYSWKILLKMLI